jgi:hypothetical protein
MTETARRHVALRIPEADLELIDQLRAKHGLDRTAYLIRAATGQLQDPIDLETRFEQIEERLARVERANFGSFD